MPPSARPRSTCFMRGQVDRTSILDGVLEQFRRECHGRSTLIGMFIEIQLQAAYADGSLDPQEDRLLRHICNRLGVSELDYRRLERMVRASAPAGAGAGPGRTGGSELAPHAG